MSIEELFTSEILRWRYASALVAVLAVQAIFPFLLCGGFKTLFVLQIWHPISLLQHLWLSPWFSGLLWPSLCFLILVRVHVHNYVVAEDRSLKVWHTVRKAIRLRSLGLLAIQVTCLSVLAQLYAASAHPHFSQLLQPCADKSSENGSGTCVNTRALLVLCLGAYCGLCYAVAYTLGSGNLVTMPTVCVPKKQKLRAMFSPWTLGKRLVAAFWGDGENEAHVVGVGVKGVVVLVISYALFGGILESWVGNALGATVSLSLGSGTSSVPGGGEATLPYITPGLPDSGLPQGNATEDVVSLQRAQSWTATVSAWQRLEVLADPVLLLVLTLVMVVLTVVLQLFHDLFTLFVMQPVSLPVTAAQDELWNLGAALKSQHPLLQLVGCHRLCQLGTAGGAAGYGARQPAFAISSPGGHPRNWQSVLKPSLALISSFTERLVKHNCPEELASLVPSAVAPSSNTSLVAQNTSVLGNEVTRASFVEKKPVNNDSILGHTLHNASIASNNAGNTSVLGNISFAGNQLGNASIAGNPMGNISLLPNADNTSMIRNAIFNSSVYGNASTMRNAAGNLTILGNATAPQQKSSLVLGQQSTQTQVKKPSAISLFKTKIASVIKERLQSLRRLPLIRTLLADLPDAANQQAFAASLPVVWAVQGLCGLVTASYAEDRYGVVQKDLNVLLAALLNLNVVLDKVGRAPLPKLCSGGGGVAVVGGRPGATPSHLRLRRALRLALRTALYRLLHTFGQSVLEIQLSPAHRSKVQSYLDMAEG